MQSDSNSKHHAVLASYAAASQRADARIASVKEQFLPALDAAKEALREAKENQLPVIDDAYERVFVAVVRKFEKTDRQAQTAHGTNITTALRSHDERKQAIGAARESKLSDARSWYAQVCAHAKSKQSCLPAYDTLKHLEVAANQVHDQDVAASHAIYLAEKERQDTILTEVIEAATAEKRQGIDEASAQHDRQVQFLLPPLQQTLSIAQSNYDRALQEAVTRNNQAREQRLGIIGAFESGDNTHSQAINALDRL